MRHISLLHMCTACMRLFTTRLQYLRVGSNAPHACTRRSMRVPHACTTYMHSLVHYIHAPGGCSTHKLPSHHACSASICALHTLHAFSCAPIYMHRVDVSHTCFTLSGLFQHLCVIVECMCRAVLQSPTLGFPF